jgi:hypothetical protein
VDCDRCQQPLIKIVRYGEQLIGCIECNCWRGGKSAFIQDLWTEDICLQPVSRCRVPGLAKNQRLLAGLLAAKVYQGGPSL